MASILESPASPLDDQVRPQPVFLDANGDHVQHQAPLPGSGRRLFHLDENGYTSFSQRDISPPPTKRPRLEEPPKLKFSLSGPAPAPIVKENPTKALAKLLGSSSSPPRKLYSHGERLSTTNGRRHWTASSSLARQMQSPSLSSHSKAPLNAPTGPKPRPGSRSGPKSLTWRATDRSTHPALLERSTSDDLRLRKAISPPPRPNLHRSNSTNSSVNGDRAPSVGRTSTSEVSSVDKDPENCSGCRFALGQSVTMACSTCKRKFHKACVEKSRMIYGAWVCEKCSKKAAREQKSTSSKSTNGKSAHSKVASLAVRNKTSKPASRTTSRATSRESTPGLLPKKNGGPSLDPMQALDRLNKAHISSTAQESQPRKGDAARASSSFWAAEKHNFFERMEARQRRNSTAEKPIIPPKQNVTNMNGLGVADGAREETPEVLKNVVNAMGEPGEMHAILRMCGGDLVSRRRTPPRPTSSHANQVMLPAIQDTAHQESLKPLPGIDHSIHHARPNGTGSLRASGVRPSGNAFMNGMNQSFTHHANSDSRPSTRGSTRSALATESEASMDLSDDGDFEGLDLATSTPMPKMGAGVGDEDTPTAPGADKVVDEVVDDVNPLVVRVVNALLEKFMGSATADIEEVASEPVVNEASGDQVVHDVNPLAVSLANAPVDTTMPSAIADTEKDADQSNIDKSSNEQDAGAMAPAANGDVTSKSSSKIEHSTIEPTREASSGQALGATIQDPPSRDKLAGDEVLPEEIAASTEQTTPFIEQTVSLTEQSAAPTKQIASSTEQIVSSIEQTTSPTEHFAAPTEQIAAPTAASTTHENSSQKLITTTQHVSLSDYAPSEPVLPGTPSHSRNHLPASAAPIDTNVEVAADFKPSIVTTPTTATTPLSTNSTPRRIIPPGFKIKKRDSIQAEPDKALRSPQSTKPAGLGGWARAFVQAGCEDPFREGKGRNEALHACEEIYATFNKCPWELVKSTFRPERFKVELLKALAGLRNMIDRFESGAEACLNELERFIVERRVKDSAADLGHAKLTTGDVSAFIAAWAAKPVFGAELKEPSPVTVVDHAIRATSPRVEQARAIVDEKPVPEEQGNSIKLVGQNVEAERTHSSASRTATPIASGTTPVAGSRPKAARKTVPARSTPIVLSEDSSGEASSTESESSVTRAREESAPSKPCSPATASGTEGLSDKSERSAPGNAEVHSQAEVSVPKPSTPTPAPVEPTEDVPEAEPRVEPKHPTAQSQSEGTAPSVSALATALFETQTPDLAVSSNLGPSTTVLDSFKPAITERIEPRLPVLRNIKADEADSDHTSDLTSELSELEQTPEPPSHLAPPASRPHPGLRILKLRVVALESNAKAASRDDGQAKKSDKAHFTVSGKPSRGFTPFTFRELILLALYEDPRRLHGPSAELPKLTSKQIVDFVEEAFPKYRDPENQVQRTMLFNNIAAQCSTHVAKGALKKEYRDGEGKSLAVYSADVDSPKFLTSEQLETMSVSYRRHRAETFGEERRNGEADLVPTKKRPLEVPETPAPKRTRAESPSVASSALRTPRASESEESVVRTTVSIRTAARKTASLARAPTEKTAEKLPRSLLSASRMGVQNDQDEETPLRRKTTVNTSSDRTIPDSTAGNLSPSGPAPAVRPPERDEVQAVGADPLDELFMTSRAVSAEDQELIDMLSAVCDKEASRDASRMAEQRFEVKDFFEHWPEHHPRNVLKFDTQAKIAEISKRPNRRQMRGQPCRPVTKQRVCRAYVGLETAGAHGPANIPFGPDTASRTTSPDKRNKFISPRKRRAMRSADDSNIYADEIDDTMLEQAEQMSKNEKMVSSWQEALRLPDRLELEWMQDPSSRLGERLVFEVPEATRGRSRNWFKAVLPED